MRLSMIGSVMFESIAAGLGTSAVGVQLGTDTLTPEALGMAVWTMILCSIGWALFATFSANKMDKIEKKVPEEIQEHGQRLLLVRSSVYFQQCAQAIYPNHFIL